VSTRRREALGALLGGGASVATPAQTGAVAITQPAAPACAPDWSALRWGVGFCEAQRKTELGDGRFDAERGCGSRMSTKS